MHIHRVSKILYEIAKHLLVRINNTSIIRINETIALSPPRIE